MSEFAAEAGQMRDVIRREHAMMVIDMERDHSVGSVVGNCVATWGKNTVGMAGTFVLLIAKHHGKDVGRAAMEILEKASDDILKMANELMNLVRGEPGLPIALIANNACKEQALGIVKQFEKFVRERTLDS